MSQTVEHETESVTNCVDYIIYVVNAGSKTVPSVNGAGNGRGTYDIALLLLLIGSCALSFAGF